MSTENIIYCPCDTCYCDDMNTDDEIIINAAIIQKFLDKYCKSRNTKLNYRTSLRQYFRCLDLDPDQYFSMNRNYDDDILTFAKSMKTVPAKTFNARMAAVKKFLLRHDAKIKPFTFEDAQTFRTGTLAVTKDRAPTHAELRDILQYADLKMKAAILVLTSSGMRIGELVQITLEDVSWDEEPIRIDIQPEYTKSGDGRYVFISTEASETLRHWKKERDDYLANSVKSINFNNGIAKPSDDTRVFPVTDSFIRKCYNKLLDRAGYGKQDKKTRYRELHVHTTRKFFISTMQLEIPEVIVHALSGHRQYLSLAYDKYTEKQIKDYYLKGMPRLLVYETSPDLSAHDERIRKLERENKELKSDMERMMRKLILHAGED